MKRKSYVSRLSISLVISCLVLSSAPLGIDAAHAAKKRNESRWFLQNVCLARANQELGNSDWTKYNQEAKESRRRLRNAGVPESHLREMEVSTTNIIKASFDGGNGSTQLCIQWYNT